MRFLHIADIHLGCRRYNLEERTRDFFRAWNDVIQNHAISNGVDFVLIAGDFFDRRNIDPQAMNHAIAGLAALKEAGIPVVAIEGNHDQLGADSEHSWMRSLSSWGYLKLLEPVHKDGLISLAPWDADDCCGSYVDIGKARIFGSKWYGTSANAAIPLLADALRDTSVAGKFNILLLHTDVEGQLNRPIPALTVEKLKELKSLTHYVALGHTHKRFSLDNWAFNPGSLEPTSIDEFKEERGAFIVDVDDEFNISAEHISDYIQRPFQRLRFDVSGAEDADAVYEGVMELVEREARVFEEESGVPAPIIEVTLVGHLGFKNSLLPLPKIRQEVNARTGALHTILRNQSVPVEYAVGVGMDTQAPRHERERRIIEDLISRDNRYKDKASEVAAMIIEAKRLALASESPDKILELVSQQVEKGRPEPSEEGIAGQGAMAALERSIGL